MYLGLWMGTGEGRSKEAWCSASNMDTMAAKSWLRLSRRELARRLWTGREGDGPRRREGRREGGSEGGREGGGAGEISVRSVAHGLTCGYTGGEEKGGEG